MKHVKKVALMLTTIILIISLTSCAFLEWLYPVPQMQEDWGAESREQTDMIFANYIDFTEKTINKYFPEMEVQYEAEEEDGDTARYVFRLVKSSYDKIIISYTCEYDHPERSEMHSTVRIPVDTTLTTTEIINAIEPYTNMLNELAQFAVYLFPEENPFNAHFHQVSGECTDSLNDDNVISAKIDKILFHLDFPEKSDAPSTCIKMHFREEKEDNKPHVYISFDGYLTNEYALEYQK